MDGATLLAGVITGAVVLSRGRELKENCPNDVCPLAFQSEADDIMRIGDAATALVVIGAITATTGAVLWLTLPGDSQPEVALRIGVTELGVVAKF